MRAGSNWRHLNGLSLGMMGDPVRCLPKVVHPDVAALKLQHNRHRYRESLSTTDWREAKRREKQRLQELVNRSPDPLKLGQTYGALDVKTAIDQYATERKAQVSPRMVS